jgi:hypothetical protein
MLFITGEEDVMEEAVGDAYPVQVAFTKLGRSAHVLMHLRGLI